MSRRRKPQSIITAHYAPCAHWLTYPEWKRLSDRAATRRRHTEPQPSTAEFIPALIASSLKKPIKATLAVMHDHANRHAHVSISQARLANLLGISERTVRRHWGAAEEAGFLTRYDYPQDLKRTSDMWLWPGNAPRILQAWPEPEPMQDSTGPIPF